MSKIRVVYVPVDGPAVPLEIEDSGAALRQLVGGYFEMHGMGLRIALVCNEDGVALGLAHNGCGIRGPYVFVRIDDQGESVSLTDDEVAMVQAHVAMYRQIQHRCAPMEVRSFDSFEDMLDFREQQRYDTEHAN